MSVTTELSDASRAMAHLSMQLDDAELHVKAELKKLLACQQDLSDAIDRRDALQKALNLTAQFVSRCTK